MQTTMMFKSLTGKVFDSQAACLFEEYRSLKESVHLAVNTLLITSGCNPDHQFDYVQRKLEACRAKAKEYLAAQRVEMFGTAEPHAPQVETVTPELAPVVSEAAA